jgi:putative transposase
MRIADWLLRFTEKNGAGALNFAFLHSRNLKDFPWKHKRVYPI